MRTKRYEACELTGAIINFETYLFATKEKFYSQFSGERINEMFANEHLTKE